MKSFAFPDEVLKELLLHFLDSNLYFRPSMATMSIEEARVVLSCFTESLMDLDLSLVELILSNKDDDDLLYSVCPVLMEVEEAVRAGVLLRIRGEQEAVAINEVQTEREQPAVEIESSSSVAPPMIYDAPLPPLWVYDIFLDSAEEDESSFDSTLSLLVELWQEAALELQQKRKERKERKETGAFDSDSAAFPVDQDNYYSELFDEEHVADTHAHTSAVEHTRQPEIEAEVAEVEAEEVFSKSKSRSFSFASASFTNEGEREVDELLVLDLVLSRLHCHNATATEEEEFDWAKWTDTDDGTKGSGPGSGSILETEITEIDYADPSFSLLRDLFGESRGSSGVEGQDCYTGYTATNALPSVVMSQRGKVYASKGKSPTNTNTVSLSLTDEQIMSVLASFNHDLEESVQHCLLLLEPDNDTRKKIAGEGARVKGKKLLCLSNTTYSGGSIRTARTSVGSSSGGGGSGSAWSGGGMALNAVRHPGGIWAPSSDASSTGADWTGFRTDVTDAELFWKDPHAPSARNRIGAVSLTNSLYAAPASSCAPEIRRQIEVPQSSLPLHPPSASTAALTAGKAGNKSNKGNATLTKDSRMWTFVVPRKARALCTAARAAGQLCRRQEGFQVVNSVNSVNSGVSGYGKERHGRYFQQRQQEQEGGVSAPNPASTVKPLSDAAFLAAAPHGNGAEVLRQLLALSHRYKEELRVAGAGTCGSSCFSNCCFYALLHMFFSFFMVCTNEHHDQPIHPSIYVYICMSIYRLYHFALISEGAKSQLETLPANVRNGLSLGVSTFGELEFLGWRGGGAEADVMGFTGFDREVDLHKVRPREALQVVESVVLHYRSSAAAAANSNSYNAYNATAGGRDRGRGRGKCTVSFIVGRGVHSEGGRAVLGPKVAECLRSLDCDYTYKEGAVEVRL